MPYHCRFALTALLLIIIRGSAASGILFYDGFESNSTQQWKKEIQESGGTAKVEISTNKVRDGRYAVRFVCNSCRRSELAGVPKFDWRKEYWVGFSFYLPKAPSGFRIINQHHSIPGDYNWSCPAGGNSFTIKGASGKLDFYTSTIASKVNVVRDEGGATANTNQFSESASLNTWHDMVLNFRYAPDNTGFMRIWLDGGIIFDHQGVTVYKYDACGEPKEPKQYLKIGLYLGGGSGEIYYDEVRIGDSDASYADVAPAGGGSGVTAAITAPGEGTTLTEGQTVTFQGTGTNMRWFWDIPGDGVTDTQFGSGESANLQIPSGAADAGEIAIKLNADEGNVSRTYAVTRPAVDNNATLIYEERFDTDGSLPPGWWSEGSSKNGIRNGHLYLDANPDGDGEDQNAGTIWCNTEFSGNLKVEYDVRILSSKDNSNNVNLFFLYSDPSGTPLYDTRGTRADGTYNKYHDLSGYILTWVANGTPDNARFRVRDLPTFDNLLLDTYTYEAKSGTTYHVEITRFNGVITYKVNKTTMFSVTDDKFSAPHERGLIGFRTWQTELWWDNLQVYRLGEATPVAGSTPPSRHGAETGSSCAPGAGCRAELYDVLGRRAGGDTRQGEALSTGIYLLESGTAVRPAFLTTGR